LNEKIVETATSKRIKTNRKTHFLASIPWEWIIRAAKCPGKAIHVALAIRHQAKLEKKNTISLGSRFLRELGVSKDAKARALAALEQEGIIRVEHKQGANPRVSIVE